MTEAETGTNDVARQVSANRFVEVARECGSDAADVRDAAHELFHAIMSGHKGDCEREEIHAAVTKRFNGAQLWLHEVKARVVEQIVCQVLGADPHGTLEQWIQVSRFEAIRHGLPYASLEISLSTAKRYLETDAQTDASAIMNWVASRAFGR